MYAATSVKRQKIARDATRPMETTDTFQGIGRIEYKHEASYTCDDQLTYRYYNATEKIHGKTMEEWLRPSVIYNTDMSFYTYPTPTVYKSFDSSLYNRTLESTKKNIRAMFELCLKLGVKYWSGYESDLIPEDDSFEENQSNLEQITELINEYQQKTGVKPLWIGVNFQHSRYTSGAMTNPDANIMAFAGYQTKRAIEMANKLNAESFLINGNRENYDNPLNTDLSKELKHYARFLKLVIEHRDKIGFCGQMLFTYEDNHSNQNHKPDGIKNFSRNEAYYTNNAFNSMLLLKFLNYDRYFKINVRPGKAFNMANVFGCLGCIEVKRPQDVKDISNIILSLRAIIEKGGFGHGGITFDTLFYHGCIDPKEVMESYVSALDSYGKALRLAVKILSDTSITKQLQARYLSYQSGWGLKFMTLDASLQDCEDNVKTLYESKTPTTSNKSNHWFVVLQRYVDAQNIK